MPGGAALARAYVSVGRVRRSRYPVIQFAPFAVTHLTLIFLVYA